LYRLLVADSDATDQEAICEMLDWSRYGFDNIIQAGSYAEAVNLALDQSPQVILVDAELDGGKGYELINKLRRSGSEAVFCLMSRRNTKDELHKALRCGARECIHQPVQEEELRSFVEWVLTEEFGGVLPQESVAPNRIDPVLQREYSEFSRITNKILLMVHNDYASSLSLTTIAAQFNMSNKYIGRIFLKDTGMRFTEYLMAYRMLEARRLIMTTPEKISVIAGLVGYSQLNNFYIHFRSYFGISPGAMRSYDPLAEMEDAYL
jgi:YesN/AraC family two-component response regulator